MAASDRDARRDPGALSGSRRRELELRIGEVDSAREELAGGG